MNLKFWKKKKTLAEGDENAAGETESAPKKPGLLPRLKNALKKIRLPSRKKKQPEEEEQPESTGARKDKKSHPGEAKPRPSRSGSKNRGEEPEEPPAKPGFLARLKSVLLPTRKKDKTEGEEKPEEPKPSAKHTGKKHQDKEPEPSDVPAKKPRKRLAIVLALLIPLAAGGGFFAAIKLFPPPQQQEAPPAKNATSQEVKIDGRPAPDPTEAAEPAPRPEPDQPLTEPAPQQADNATTPAAEVPEPPAEAPVADAPTPADEGVQAQIEAMKKQHQEMQAQIEALKKQPIIERPARSAATPREGVLIINGKNAKESAQGLKSVIEEMNAASGGRSPRKPADKP